MRLFFPAATLVVLGLLVVCFKAMPPSNSASSQGTIYKNEAYGYQFMLPKDWSVFEPDDQQSTSTKMVYVALHPRDESGLTIAFEGKKGVEEILKDLQDLTTYQVDQSVLEGGIHPVTVLQVVGGGQIIEKGIVKIDSGTLTITMGRSMDDKDSRDAFLTVAETLSVAGER